MTLGQFNRCFNGWKDVQEEQTKRQDALNHLLGQYILIAFNNPKKYPKEPLMAKSKQAKQSGFANDADIDRFIGEQSHKGK